MSELVDSIDVTEAQIVSAETVAREGDISDRPDTNIVDSDADAISMDLNFIKTELSPAAILTSTREFVNVIIMRTPYSRVQLRVQYPPTYPSEIAIIELSSPSLPPNLLRTKEKECRDIAKEHINLPQLQHVFHHIEDFIHGNLFIPCWKEVKQIMALCKDKGKLGADEKTGLLQFRINSTDTGHYQAFRIRVPPLYPEEGVTLEFTTSSFPEDIQCIYFAQAEEICRRCVAGHFAESAMQVGTGGHKEASATEVAGKSAWSRPSAVAAVRGSTGPDAVAMPLTAGGLQSLKRDVTVLKQMSELREVSSQVSSRDYDGVCAERKAARKGLKRLARSEAAHDEEELQRLKELEEQEMAALVRMKISETAQPSLLPVVKFLVEEYVCRLSKEPCQSCQKLVLSPVASQSSTEAKPRKSKTNMRPMRTFCGHWLHFDCLDEWLTTPPFIRQCPVCDKRIWHPDWPDDVKQVERAWQNEQARKREMADVADFLDL